MSAKISASRQAAFLRALGETGNETLSAERARVSRSWVRLHRSRDPEFEAACREAIAGFSTSLEVNGKRGAARRPPCGWGHFDGMELVVRGTGGAGGGKRVQIARARLNEITPRVEDRFLKTLAATCNVKAALAEAGISKGAAYSRRKRSPAFAKRWDVAVKVAYRRLDNERLASAMNLFATPEVGDFDAPIPPMSVAQVIHYLGMHRHEVTGIGKAPGVRRRKS